MTKVSLFTITCLLSMFGLQSLSAHAEGSTVCQFAVTASEHKAGIPLIRITMEQTDNQYGVQPLENGHAVAIYNVVFGGTRDKNGQLHLDEPKTTGMFPAGHLAADIYPDVNGAKAIIRSTKLDELVAKIKSNDKVADFVLSTVSEQVRDYIGPKNPVSAVLIRSFQKNLNCR